MNLLKTSMMIVIALLIATVPISAKGYDLDIHSDTYLHLYQQDQVSGPDTDHAPLYEYLSLDIWEAGRPEFSFHLYGWGRADLKEETDPDSDDGYLSSAHIRYLSKGGNSQIRAGRMFLIEGTTVETLDGLHLRTSLGTTGLAIFGGSPNGGGSEDSRGDMLTGARSYYIIPGKMELGLNYLEEDGDFDGEKRQEAGTDLWFKPAPSVEITGHALYNLSTSGLASDDLSLNLTLSPTLDFAVATQGYIYEDLFQSVTNPAFLSSVINLDDEVRIMEGEFNWSPVNWLVDIRGAYKNTSHKEDDPGDNNRAEIGLDLDTTVILDRIGFRLASQTGDLPENEYSSMRAFCTARSGSMRWSLDALAITYEEEISGVDQTTQFVGSAGWELSDSLDVSGDVRITKSPVFDEDLAIVLRARYDFGAGSGAN